MRIDTNATLEFGFRIQSTQASYRELENLLGSDQKIAWARTQAHPNQTKYFKVEGVVEENLNEGRIEVPENVVDAFTRHKGFLMVKLVSALPTRHYANLAVYSQDGGGKLWEFDKMDPQRPNGDWVYSMPIHGLDKPGEGKRFFFVVRLDGGRESMMLTVDRIEIYRGAKHFSVRRKTYKSITAKPADMEAVAKQFEVPKGGEMIKPLQGLPIGQAVREALKRV